MEISIINGSPRENGATGRILREIERILVDSFGVSINYYNLSKLDIELCKGCEICYQTAKCFIKNDDFEKVANIIKQSDGIIIGSPTHGSNVSAYLKNFMDRGHFIVEQALYGKNCFSVVTYEIADGKAALNILNKFLMVSGGAVNTNLLVKLPFNTNPIENEKIVKKIHYKTKRFFRAVQKKQTKSIFEYIFNDIIIVNIIWKLYFKKNPKQFKGIIESYKKKGLYPSFSKMIK